MFACVLRRNEATAGLPAIAEAGKEDSRTPLERDSITTVRYRRVECGGHA